MSLPCSKEADIATLVERVSNQGVVISEIKTDTGKILGRLAANDIKWAKLGMVGILGGILGSAIYELAVKKLLG